MEFPLINKKWTKNANTLDIVYPNKYYGGVYCLGPLVIYNLVNSLEDWICNRVFLDKGKISSKLIGFTLQYELDYYNLVKMLKSSNINLKKESRKEIVFAGGPCIKTNPETLSKYLDFAILGDAEEVLPEVLKLYEDSKSKYSFLESISSMPGVYVYGLTKNPCYARVSDFNKVPYPIYQPFEETLSKDFVFGKTFILETERGCPYKCKFCSLPQLNNKTSFRNFDKIKEIIDKGLEINRRNDVSIYAASFIHPDRIRILKYLLEKKVTFTVPAVKIEAINEEFLSLVKAGGTKSITLAPECNERLRSSLGKHYSDDRIFEIIDIANKLGFEGIKFYFMIGLPGMEDSDLVKMSELASKLKSRFNGKSYFSINPLVSKPKTDFEGLNFDKKSVSHQAKLIHSLLNKQKIPIKPINVSASYKEWKLANASEF